MNPTLKNWFTLSLWLGITYAVMLAGLVAIDAGEDFITPVVQAAGFFLWLALLGEIADMLMFCWKAHKAQKAQAS